MVIFKKRFYFSQCYYGIKSVLEYLFLHPEMLLTPFRRKQGCQVLFTVVSHDRCEEEDGPISSRRTRPPQVADYVAYLLGITSIMLFSITIIIIIVEFNWWQLLSVQVYSLFNSAVKMLCKYVFPAFHNLTQKKLPIERRFRGKRTNTDPLLYDNNNNVFVCSCGRGHNFQVSRCTSEVKSLLSYNVGNIRWGWWVNLFQGMRAYEVAALDEFTNIVAALWWFGYVKLHVNALNKVR